MESLAGAGLNNLSSAQKDELMDRVRAQMALANAQELLAVSWLLPTNQSFVFIEK